MTDAHSQGDNRVALFIQCSEQSSAVVVAGGAAAGDAPNASVVGNDDALNSCGWHEREPHFLVDQGF